MEIKVHPGNEYASSDTFSSNRLDWRQYEAYVFGTLQRLVAGAKITRNVRVTGLKTGRRRQIDILVERDLGGFNLKIVVDCKSYGRKVNVKHVESFLGMLDDIRVSKGVLMTTTGYSKTAWNRAQNESRDIELHILTVEQLSKFHGIGGAIPWNGPVAAMVSPPDTWVIDNEHVPIPGVAESSRQAPQFTFYPLGHTRISAATSVICPFIYGNIILKWPEAPTIEAIASYHEKRVLEKFPMASFERLPSITREAQAGDEPERTILRIGRIHAGYKGPEYSLYIDHPKGVLLLVLFCPEGKDDVYLPVLKWVGEKALMLDCVDTRGAQPLNPATP